MRRLPTLVLFSLGCGGDAAMDPIPGGTEAGTEVGSTASTAPESTGAEGGISTAGAGSSGSTDDSTGTPAEVPDWVLDLPVRQWTPLPGTEFDANATAVVPADAYRGTNPIGAIVDAYGDPVYDARTQSLYFHGGGHGDGSCNAVVGLDLPTLTYRLAGAPTPASAYPPGFMVEQPYVYPSGLPLSWFHTAEQLNEAVDLAYAAPASAPVQTHQYGSQAVRNELGVPHEIRYFYGRYKVFDLELGAWTDAHEQPADVISQKVAAQAEAQYPGLGANVGPTVALQQGTMAVYDAATDAYYVTFIPGDAGGGWREFFFRYDPASDAVTEVFRPAVPCRESMGWLVAGRWLYGFISPYDVPNPGRVVNTGFRFHLDTEAFEYFTITGDVVSFEANSNQEAAPAWYAEATDAIHTWNHNSADADGIYSLPVAELGAGGGSGTIDEPWQWPQTRITVPGAPLATAYKYNGLVYVADWDVMVVMPKSTSVLFALRM